MKTPTAVTTETLSGTSGIISMRWSQLDAKLLGLLAASRILLADALSSSEAPNSSEPSEWQVTKPGG